MLFVVSKVLHIGREGKLVGDLCLGDIRIGNMTGKDISQESVYSCLSEMAATGPECEDSRVEAHSGSSLIHSASISGPHSISRSALELTQKEPIRQTIQVEGTSMLHAQEEVTFAGLVVCSALAELWYLSEPVS